MGVNEAVTVGESRRSRFAAALLAALAASCEGAPPLTNPPPPPPPPPPDTCPAGTLRGPDGACTAAGIQGCAAMFVEADGRCRPSVSKCPAGTIPRFDEGCVPVGIQGCAAAFLEEDGLCHPAMSKCPAGTFAVPQEGCVAVDGPSGCGEGPWGSIADGSGVIYVDPSAPAGGAGTKASPVATLAEALALVTEGGRIALAAGTYHEPLHLTQPVTVEGRCASLVRIDGTMATTTTFDAVVWVDGASAVALRGLEIGGPAVGIVADGAPGLHLEQVHVRSARGHGILISGPASDAALRHVWVEGTTDSLFGAVRVDQGARVVIDGSAITRNEIVGIQAVGDGADITVQNSLVERTLAHPTKGYGGTAVGIFVGARVTLVSSAVREGRDDAVLVQYDGSHLQMTGSIVEKTLPYAGDDSGGHGIYVDFDASATLTGNAILDNHTSGVFVVGSQLTATGNLIAGTRPNAQNQGFGRGMEIDDARATLSGNAVVNNHEVGLFVSAAQITAHGNVFSGTTPQESDGQWGMGVTCRDTAIFALTSCLLEDNHAAAILVQQCHVTVSQSLVDQVHDGSFSLPTHPEIIEHAGDGLIATRGARVDLTSVWVQGAVRAGLLYDDTTGTLGDVVSTGNAFGLVLQGQNRPSYLDGGNQIGGNATKDVVASGDLPIPDAPSPLPL